MKELLKRIEYIESDVDTRQQKKVCHRLKDIFVIVLFPLLTNADGLGRNRYIAAYHEEYLRKSISLKTGVPSHDTIQRVMAIVPPGHPVAEHGEEAGITQ